MLSTGVRELVSLRLLRMTGRKLGRTIYFNKANTGIIYVPI